MTVKTVTTWNTLLSPAQIQTLGAALYERDLAGEFGGPPVLVDANGNDIPDRIPTSAPYTVTREWPTEAVARNWSAWLDTTYPDVPHSTQIVF